MAGELAIEQLKHGALAMSELDKLELVLQSITATVDAIDGRQHIERNRQFHGSIVELSGNQLLMTMYRGIQGQLLGAWVRRGLDTWRNRVAAESVDHGEMLAALRSLDAPRYAAAARRHVDTSLRNALNDLRIAENKRDPAGAGEVTPPSS